MSNTAMKSKNVESRKKLPRKKMLIYHYTIAEKYSQIVSDGHIKLATAGIEHPSEAAVWFTTRDDWDETAGKGICFADGNRVLSVTADMTLCHHLTDGLVRITCHDETATVDWQEYSKRAKLPRKTKYALEGFARTAGSHHRDWRVSFDPVETARFVAVDFWDGKSWQKEQRKSGEMPQSEIEERINSQIRRGRYWVAETGLESGTTIRGH